MTRRTTDMTPAQVRAASEVFREVDGNWFWKRCKATGTAVLTAALDEEEIAGALGKAPCIVYLPVVNDQYSCVHPECVARAVLDLILGSA